MKIIRKDGIEYEKNKTKVLNYDKPICVKLSSLQIEAAKEKCKELKISFAELIRRGIDNVINEEKVELNENNQEN